MLIQLKHISVDNYKHGDMPKTRLTVFQTDEENTHSQAPQMIDNFVGDDPV